MLKQTAAELYFSILDTHSLPSFACVPGKLRDVSQIPASIPISDHLNEAVAKQHLSSLSFSLSLSSIFLGVQLYLKNPGCAGCEHREKMLLKVLLMLPQSVIKKLGFRIFKFYQNNA